MVSTGGEIGLGVLRSSDCRLMDRRLARVSAHSKPPCRRCQRCLHHRADTVDG